MNIPNAITIGRVILIPGVVAFYLLPFLWAQWMAAVLFFLAVTTDWLDGFLARQLGQVSRLGAFLDPIADKLLVLAGLMLLVRVHTQWWFLVGSQIILARELLMSGLREWMAGDGRGIQVAVSGWGKWKTAFQGAAISILLVPVPQAWRLWAWPVGYAAFFIAVLLTLGSMVLYCRRAWASYQAIG